MARVLGHRRSLSRYSRNRYLKHLFRVPFQSVNLSLTFRRTLFQSLGRDKSGCRVPPTEQLTYDAIRVWCGSAAKEKKNLNQEKLVDHVFSPTNNRASQTVCPLVSACTGSVLRLRFVVSSGRDAKSDGNV